MPPAERRDTHERNRRSAAMPPALTSQKSCRSWKAATPPAARGDGGYPQGSTAFWVDPLGVPPPPAPDARAAASSDWRLRVSSSSRALAARSSQSRSGSSSRASSASAPSRSVALSCRRSADAAPAAVAESARDRCAARRRTCAWMAVAAFCRAKSSCPAPRRREASSAPPSPLSASLCCPPSSASPCPSSSPSSATPSSAEKAGAMDEMGEGARSVADSALRAGAPAPPRPKPPWAGSVCA